VSTVDNLQAFGDYVQIYHNTHIGVLFSINKFDNFITFGDQVYNNSTKTLQFETFKEIQGNVEVCNLIGLKITNIKDKTSALLVNH
jgi:hypothetical protein